MNKPNKKPAKKPRIYKRPAVAEPVPVAPRPTRANHPVLPLRLDDRIQRVLDETRETSLLVVDRYAQIAERGVILQSDLSTAHLFKQIAASAEEPYAAFVEAARRAYATAEQTHDGPDRVRVHVETGARVLLWEDHRRVTISWKEVAVDYAAKLVELSAAVARGDLAAAQMLAAGQPKVFDATAWERDLKLGRPKTGNINPKIVEA